MKVTIVTKLINFSSGKEFVSELTFSDPFEEQQFWRSGTRAMQIYPEPDDSCTVDRGGCWAMKVQDLLGTMGYKRVPADDRNWCYTPGITTWSKHPNSIERERIERMQEDEELAQMYSAGINSLIRSSANEDEDLAQMLSAGSSSLKRSSADGVGDYEGGKRRRC